MNEANDLLIYKNSEGNIIVDAIFKDETLWLTQKGMSKVFDCSTDNISLHLKNIFKDNELDENSVVEDSSVTASDGKNYKTNYNPKSEEAYTFFKIVQNKLHFAISGHTAAELIYSRADSNKEHMGLTNWKNSPDGLIYKYDVSIAKNYLNKEELEKLNDLTNIFLVFAEDEAKERHVMTMQDWINATDDLLKFRRKKILDNSGNISHKQAVEKAESEYEKYRVIQDQKYVSTMDEFYNKYLEENKE